MAQQVTSAICGYCVIRDAVIIDPDDRVPCCGVCAGIVGPSTKPTHQTRAERVLRFIGRNPGVTGPELVDMLEVAEVDRPAYAQIVSRHARRGLVRAEGSGRSRRYFLVENRTATSCETNTPIDADVSSPPVGASA